MGVFDVIGGRRKPKIFICYRRHGEGSGYGGRVADKLVKHFGLNQCFRDIENIEAGVDFVTSIRKAVGVCEVLVVVIGPDWAAQKDKYSRPRLQDPRDFVRLEVGAALKRNIRVIPVLVGGAQLPVENDLPEDLKELPRRQARELTDTRWDYDTDQLINAIESIGIKGRSPAEQEARNRRMKIGAAVVLTSVVVLLGMFLLQKITAPPPEQAELAGQTLDQPTNKATGVDGGVKSLRTQLEAERKARLEAEKRAEESRAQLERDAGRRAAKAEEERTWAVQEAGRQRAARAERERPITGLSGSVEVHWVFQGYHYASTLDMDGAYGTAEVTFTDQFSREYTVIHDLQFITAPALYDFDYLLLGSNPSNQSYIPDSFAAVYIGGYIQITKTCDELGQCSELTSVYGTFRLVR